MLNSAKLEKKAGGWGSYNLIAQPSSHENGQKKRKRFLQFLFIVVLLLGYVTAVMGQTNMNDINFQAESEFQPTIKDAVKYSDIPEIRDTVKRINNSTYGIASNPLFPKYEVAPITPAKMQNEPLSKLYHSMIKVGYGPVYNMPYGELWYNSLRSREMAYGVHYKHFSSMSQMDKVGYSGFSDNEAEIFAKKFYKKHTLSGDFNYKRNVVNYYGFDNELNHIDNKNYTKQRFQLFEPSVQLQSHYTDSSKINHSIKLSYYNLQDIYNSAENNIKLFSELGTYINKEHFHVNVLADYYNHKKSNDTINDFIFTLNPYFEANGKKWHADLGLAATVDAFGSKTKFYFYPQLNVFYDVYESIIVPYAGASGGLIKNSYRSLTNENPFINPNVHYANTHNKFNVFGGLRGNLSYNTSYDAKVSYGQYDSLQFFVIDYSDLTQLDNKFNVVYDNTSLLNVSGQVKYQYKEKIHFIAKGNYYLYKTKNLIRAYHKTDYDITLSAIYNLKSKIIIKGDVFAIGNQWALTEVKDGEIYKTEPKLLNSLIDVNLGAEYRYSKMLSFFVKFNNIASMKYMRWEKYPTQGFNMMIGLTFIPF